MKNFWNFSTPSQIKEKTNTIESGKQLELIRMEIQMLFNLISESHPKFSNLLDELLEKAEVLPVYATAHKNYYEILYKKQIIKNSSFLLTVNDRILGAFLGYEYENKSTNNNLSYFGMPCVFVIMPGIKDELKISISNRMISQLTESQIIKKLAILDFEIIFPFHTVNTIGSIEKFIKVARKHQINYERAINLLEEEQEIFANLSKSVKSAVKKSKSQSVKTYLFDNESTISEQSYAISVLKKMHLEAAGRQTRTDESWDEQSNQLREGSILVTHGNVNNETIHSSLFLLNGKTAYYGVSANKIGSSDSSVSHYFLYQTMIELKNRGFTILFMGRQYESMDMILSNKQKGIQQFKSFFGGNLKPFLGFSSNA
jgi:hypothetical protein